MSGSRRPSQRSRIHGTCESRSPRLQNSSFPFRTWKSSCSAALHRYQSIPPETKHPETKPWGTKIVRPLRQIHSQSLFKASPFAGIQVKSPSGPLGRGAEQPLSLRPSTSDGATASAGHSYLYHTKWTDIKTVNKMGSWQRGFCYDLLP